MIFSIIYLLNLFEFHIIIKKMNTKSKVGEKYELQ